MGCGGSVNKPCSEEEKAELCEIGCKEMEVVCVRAAMGKKAELTIAAPPAVSNYRKNADRLREAAKVAVKEIDENMGGEKAQAAVGDKAGGGFFGKVLNAAAQAVDTAAAVAGGTLGAVMEKSLNGLASAIDSAVEKVEEPFSKVAQEIVAAKEDDLLQVYADFINQYKFQDPVRLVRGEAPHGEEQYKACPGDSISKALTVAAVEELAKKLLPVVQEEINKHAVTKAWDKLIETGNAAYDKAAETGLTEKLGIEKIQLDINTYIVTETILKLGELMGKAEAETRLNPAQKSRVPATFAVVFSGETLTKGHYMNKNK